MNREVDHDNSAAEAYSKLTTESFIEKAPLITEAYDTST